MHDYNLCWDYEITVPRDDFRIISESVRKEIARDIKSIIPSFEVGFVKNTGRLGVYINGTESSPVVALDVGQIRRATKKHGVSLRLTIMTTIMHELGHALQAIHGLDMDENVAEEFAFNYWLYGTIKNFWLS